MLHLIFQSTLELAVVNRIEPGDVVVFLGNSVLRTLKNSGTELLLGKLLANNRIYAMADQLVICGIQRHELVSGIETIDYDGLVVLTSKHAVIHSWT